MEVVLKLLKYKPNINTLNNSSITILYQLVYNQQYRTVKEIVKALLQNQANINKEDFSGHTPLDYIFLKINLTANQVLLANGTKKGINPLI